jgi:hypothetical protein
MHTGISGGGRQEGNRPLVRTRHRWDDNIVTDLREMGRGGSTGLIWLRIGTNGELL